MYTNHLSSHHTLFSINKLNVSCGKKCLLAIAELNLPSQQLVALIGANGAGKSTLLKALLGQNQGLQCDGNITCAGKPNTDLVRYGKVAWVGQHERFEIPLTTMDYALLGTVPALQWYQTPTSEHKSKAQSLLADFDLLPLAQARVQTLSGGEKQRLAMVRALMQDTDVLLLDEPTNHLDIKHQRLLLNYLQQLVKHQHKSIIVVLHNLTHAYQYADSIVALHQGKLVAQGTPATVMTETRLSQMYQVAIKKCPTSVGCVFI